MQLNNLSIFCITIGKIEFYPLYIKMLFTIHLWGMCAFHFFGRVLSFSWSILILSTLMAKKYIFLKIQYLVEITLNGFHLTICQTN